VRGNESSRFSLVGFAVALVTVGFGAAVGLRFVPGVGTYVGMLAGGFVAGLAIEHRPTVESGLAAVLAGLGVLVAGALPGSSVFDAIVALAAVNPVPVLLGSALSFAVGAFGGHFGDDLRDGLTEPVPESSAGPGAPARARTSRIGSVDGDAERDSVGDQSSDRTEAVDAVADDPSSDPDRSAEDLEYELEEDY